MRAMVDISDEALFYGALLRSRREFVRALYKNEGHIANPSGRATYNLMVEAGLTENSMTSVAGVLRAMEEDGWIEREVRGKRTFDISLKSDNPVVSRLVSFFEENTETDVEAVPEPEAVEEEIPQSEDTSIVDAAMVADELLMRVVDILNNPTSEDLHHRLGEQTEYTNTLRARCAKMEQEISELKTTLEAKDARIAALNRENTQLESNLRAALRQERSVVGSGIRALEKFMQEKPRVKG